MPGTKGMIVPWEVFPSIHPINERDNLAAACMQALVQNGPVPHNKAPVNKYLVLGCVITIV